MVQRQVHIILWRVPCLYENLQLLRNDVWYNFVQVFLKFWRDSAAKVEWILFKVSDPRQLEQEMPQYIIAHYRSAFIFLWELRSNTQDNCPSAMEVHEYMLARSANSPYHQAVLLHLCYYKISKLMRMSSKIGKRGSVSLFMTTVCYSLALWATTHAVDYV